MVKLDNFKVFTKDEVEGKMLVAYEDISKGSTVIEYLDNKEIPKNDVEEFLRCFFDLLCAEESFSFWDVVDSMESMFIGTQIQKEMPNIISKARISDEPLTFYNG